MTSTCAAIRMVAGTCSLAVAAWLAPGTWSDEALATRANRCGIGRIVAEKTILAPSNGTFYSVDALNPDIVARRGRYYMFFSGNHVHTPAGNWRTGLAVASRPQGPFRLRSLRGNYLNGGTVVWKGRFYQARTHNAGAPELATSTDGVRWRRVATVPQTPAGTDYRSTADYALERIPRGLRLYFLARKAPFYGDIATLDWVGGRWRRPRTLLQPSRRPWENLDLGEPETIRLGGRHYLLYVGTALSDYVRTIGLAYETRSGRWRRCSRRPLIGAGASWGAAVSIDPSPLVVGRRLYVYYGGGSNTSIASDLRGAIGVRVYVLPAQAR